MAENRSTLLARDLRRLRRYADQYEATQRVLFGGRNRERSEIQGADLTPSQPEPMDPRWLQHMAAALVELQRDMEKLIPNHPAYTWLMGIPGINRVLICKLVGLIPMEGPLCLQCGKDLTHAYKVRLCRKCCQLTDAEECRSCKTAKGNPIATEVAGHTLICGDCQLGGHDFPNFSSLRKFSGYAPGMGRLVSGEKSVFSQRLKTCLHVAWDTINKSAALVKDPNERPPRLYPEIYHNWRNIYAHREGVGTTGRLYMEKRGKHPDQVTGYKRLTGSIEKTGPFFFAMADMSEIWTMVNGEKQIVSAAEVKAIKSWRPDWPDSRQHLAARRKVIDVFLSHLWTVWRTEAGWPVREMYVKEKLGHQMEYDPKDFSSPAYAERKIKKSRAGGA